MIRWIVGTAWAATPSEEVIAALDEALAVDGVREIVVGFVEYTDEDTLDEALRERPDLVRRVTVVRVGAAGDPLDALARRMERLSFTCGLVVARGQALQGPCSGRASSRDPLVGAIDAALALDGVDRLVLGYDGWDDEDAVRAAMVAAPDLLRAVLVVHATSLESVERTMTRAGIGCGVLVSGREIHTGPCDPSTSERGAHVPLPQHTFTVGWLPLLGANVRVSERVTDHLSVFAEIGAAVSFFDDGLVSSSASYARGQVGADLHPLAGRTGPYLGPRALALVVSSSGCIGSLCTSSEGVGLIPGAVAGIRVRRRSRVVMIGGGAGLTIPGAEPYPLLELRLGVAGP